MTCGGDVSSMKIVSVKNDSLIFKNDLSNIYKPSEILVLGATNGSYCMRKVGRREDGRVHCVLMTCFTDETMHSVGDKLVGKFEPLVESCPITFLAYNEVKDAFLFGDAGGVATEVIM